MKQKYSLLVKILQCPAAFKTHQATLCFLLRFLKIIFLNFPMFLEWPLLFVVIADVNTCSPIRAGQESQAVNLFKRML